MKSRHHAKYSGTGGRSARRLRRKAKFRGSQLAAVSSMMQDPKLSWLSRPKLSTGSKE